MGKVKDVVISLGHSRRMAEEIEYELRQAGVLKEEVAEKVEVVGVEEDAEKGKEEVGSRKNIKTKNISEVIASG
ncbi:MAG: hypothetical protein ABID54_00150 [Pseudomonadota bacterium]